MFKKLLIVLLILAPSMLYIYIVNRDDNKAAETKTVTTPAEKIPTEQYQTPDH
ncbi:hypothetical protein [Acinetobacter sp. ASP199]|uniref:hypothetical protein n=1 Tax=unclassified Acinetobacter TaxID=196816 RepID=UPI001F619AFC|nr:hypothetical protein [Acinetobacter sp. ASP199]UNT60088.1 hypothetical protein IHE35_04505 [Acinetobacter sp. ASP199]